MLVSRMHKGWLNYSLLCYKYLQILVGVVSNRDDKSLAECGDSDGYFRLFAIMLHIVRKLGRTGTPLFLLALCQTQGTRPSTLCTAFFMPSWSREDVKYTSWTCLPARARSVNLLSLAGTLESQSSKSCETTRFSNTWRPNCTSVIL